MRKPSSVRLLGFGGLLAAGLVAIGGFFDMPWLVGFSGAIMIAANGYALAVGERTTDASGTAGEGKAT